MNKKFDKNAQGFLTQPEMEWSQINIENKKKIFGLKQELKLEQFELYLKMLHKMEHLKIELQESVDRMSQKRKDRKSMRNAPKGLQSELKQTLKIVWRDFEFKQTEFV